MHPFGEADLARSRSAVGRLLRDRVTLYKVGPKTTSGYHTTRELVKVGEYAALVQSVSIPPVGNTPGGQEYSVKLPWATPCSPGMVAEVTESSAEPELVGRRFTLLTVSSNGAALLRKATAVAGVQTNVEGQ